MFENLKKIFTKPTVNDLVNDIENSAFSVTHIPSLVDVKKIKKATIYIQMENKDIELEYSCSSKESVLKWKKQAANLMNGKNEVFEATMRESDNLSTYDYVKHDQVTHIRIVTPPELDSEYTEPLGELIE